MTDKENNNYRYIAETYTDDYHTLFQMIELDMFMKEQDSTGMYLFFARHNINPNLKHLIRKEYFDEKHNLLFTENFRIELQNN